MLKGLGQRVGIPVGEKLGFKGRECRARGGAMACSGRAPPHPSKNRGRWYFSAPLRTRVSATFGRQPSGEQLEVAPGAWPGPPRPLAGPSTAAPHKRSGAVTDKVEDPNHPDPHLRSSAADGYSSGRIPSRLRRKSDDAPRMSRRPRLRESPARGHGHRHQCTTILGAASRLRRWPVSLPSR